MLLIHSDVLLQHQLSSIFLMSALTNVSDYYHNTFAF